MKTIILYGEDADTRLTFPLCRALEYYGGVIHLHGGSISECSAAAPEFLLYETSSLESVQVSCGMILLKENAVIDGRTPGIGGIGALIAPGAFPESGRPAALPIIRCGTGEADTVALSSLEEGRAIVTVQQGITVGERQYEPHDIRVQLSYPLEPYPLTACCAVLLLARGEETEHLLL